MSVHRQLIQAKAANRKTLAVLLDPDKWAPARLGPVLDVCEGGGVDFLFIGGSLLMNPRLHEFILYVKERCRAPLVLFPGSVFQIDPAADTMLLLSLISGRNPELLIGQQVAAAPFLKASGMEVLSCGYMLIDGGKPTAVQYMSNTHPIPADKPDLAVSTALAGELLGLRTIYLEAGSGAPNPAPLPMIRAVAGTISVPLIVGGGVRKAETALEMWDAGADLLVVGNAIEQEPDFLNSLIQAKKQ